jgi:regulator of replication initiation timing
MKDKKELVTIDEQSLAEALAAFNIDASILKGNDDDFNKPAAATATAIAKPNPFLKGAVNEPINVESRAEILKGLGLFESFEKAENIINGFGEIQVMVKGFVGNINTLTETVNTLEGTIGGLNENIEALKTENAELKKGLTVPDEYQTAIEKLITDTAEMREKIGTISEMPNPRKSIVQDYIEKGASNQLGQGGAANTDPRLAGKIIMSASKNRMQIIASMQELSGISDMSKGIKNETLKQGCLAYEAGGTFTKEVLAELNKNNIFITE